MRAIWCLLLLSACTFEVNGTPGDDDVAKAQACSTSIGAGYRHSCAIDDAGAAWCWGRNDYGQIGDGTTDDRVKPTAVTASGTAFTQISGGVNHTCAVAKDGTAWCWGRNDDGQLGNAQVSDSHVPVQVRDLKGVAQIVTGAKHSCARDEGGKVTCWGNSELGQLGVNGSSNVPTPLSLPVPAMALAASAYVTCIIDSAGAAWCWGANDRGQLGVGTTTQSEAPTQLLGAGGSGLVDVAIGDRFVCVLSSAGVVSCTGSNERGQLGRVGDDSTTLVPVLLPVPAKHIAAGDQFACAIAEDKRAWCWGYNGDSQLTEQRSEQRTVPVLTTFTNVDQLAAGGGHVCARAGAAVQCAGYNGTGQLGNGRRTTQASAQPVPALHMVTSVAPGWGHTCASRADGKVLCWGNNDVGQLGDGQWERRGTPQEVPGVADVKRVVSGGGHACALGNDGAVACWGANDHGQLGDGSRVTRGVVSPVSLPVKATQLIAGGGHTCALGANGLVYCWGRNDVGQVGNNQPEHDDAFAPTQVVMLSGVTGLAGGEYHTCAITGNRTVACWGYNGFGQLGNGDQTSKDVPVAVLGASNIDQLASFGNSTCAHVMTDNSILCWGAGNSGQIGDGNYSHRSTPTKVLGLQASQVAAGGYFACATKLDRSVACWGAGYIGQLGAGKYEGATAPTSVLNLAMVREVAAGDEHACAILENGDLSCWGDGREGELGDGSLRDVSPTDVLMTCAAK